MVSAPALRRRWWAARGEGAYADGEPIRVSSVATLEAAHLAHAGVGTFFEYGHGDALVGLTRRVWRARGLGDFWMHCLVAEGAFDVAVEPVVSLWDLAAITVIVEEAGGRFTDLRGDAGPGRGLGPVHQRRAARRGARRLRGPLTGRLSSLLSGIAPNSETINA